MAAVPLAPEPESPAPELGSLQRDARTLSSARSEDYPPLDDERGMTRVTLGKSRVRESVRRGKRRVEYPSQTEGAGRGASGSTILPDGESLMGQEHDGKAGVWASMPDPTPCNARAIWSRLNCLNPSHQRWKRTSRATAYQGAAGRIGRFSFRHPKLPLAERGPTRPFKGANKGPKSR